MGPERDLGDVDGAESNERARSPTGAVATKSDDGELGAMGESGSARDESGTIWGRSMLDSTAAGDGAANVLRGITLGCDRCQRERPREEKHQVRTSVWERRRGARLSSPGDCSGGRIETSSK